MNKKFLSRVKDLVNMKCACNMYCLAYIIYQFKLPLNSSTCGKSVWVARPLNEGDYYKESG